MRVDDSHVIESAIMSIQPGREADFLAALAQAEATVLARSPGFVRLGVHRGIERPSTFLLTLAWRTLEDHTEVFRGGELFAEWRALIGPYFAEPPQVEHWQVLGPAQK